MIYNVNVCNNFKCCKYFIEKKMKYNMHGEELHQAI